MNIIKSIFFNSRYRFTKVPDRLILYSDKQLLNIHQKKKNKQSTKEKISLQSNNQFTVSLIGSPNSGKSTLFNTIIGERIALTDAIPGMTRDRKQLKIWNGLLRLIDTPGIQRFKNILVNKQNNQNSQKQIKKQILKQTLISYNQSDLVLYVIDGKKGITKEEIQFVDYFRKYGDIKKVSLVVNKCENDQQLQLANEIYKLGIKQIYYVSGQLGYGVLQLMQSIQKKIPPQKRQILDNIKQKRKQKFKLIMNNMKEEIKLLHQNQQNFSIKNWQKQFLKYNKNPQQNSQLDDQQVNNNSFTKPQQAFTSGRGTSQNNLMLKKPIQICIIGRPNVGKTSLVNKIIGQQKLVVSDVAHTTRDSSINSWIYKNRKIQLVDTAGLSTKNFDSNPEHLKKVQISTMNHVKYSHVVIYLLDSQSAMKNIDFNFIKKVIQQGRPIILAINKWQMIKPEYKKKATNYIKQQVKSHLGQLNQPSIIYISVKLDQGIDHLMDQILSIYEKWNRRVSTGMLNNWLTKFKKLDNLPIDGLQKLKIRFLVQGKVRPPSFIVFVNNKQLFKNNYLRFMRSNLVEQFKLSGIPIRIILKNTQKTKKDKEENKTQKQINFKKWKQFRKRQKRKQRLAEFKLKYGNFGKKQ